MNAELSVRGIDRTIMLLTLGGFASGANVRLMDTVSTAEQIQASGAA